MDHSYGPRRLRRRDGLACSSRGWIGSVDRERSGRTSSLAGRTATRALVAAGAYVAQDLRDPEGLTRPLLRRAAFRLLEHPAPALQRLGAAYLRRDGHDLPGAQPRLALPAPPNESAGSAS